MLGREANRSQQHKPVKQLCMFSATGFFQLLSVFWRRQEPAASDFFLREIQNDGKRLIT